MKLMNRKTLPQPISDVNTFAWQTEPREGGCRSKMYHSSYPQHSRQQQFDGNMAVDSIRGLYAMPLFALHPSAKSCSDGANEPLSTAVMAKYLPTIALGHNDSSRCENAEESSVGGGPQPFRRWKLCGSAKQVRDLFVAIDVGRLSLIPVPYCEDGRIEMDNNAAERALRAVALGRKN